MSDPATTEITGPTIVDPTNPDLDYSYCDSDRRHVVNVVGRGADAGVLERHACNVLFSDWQIAPLVRWQSGNRSSVTTGVDNALTGMGGQRAVQILDDPYGDGTPNNYLNRAAFTSPAAGTYSTLKPNTIDNPSRLQNDLAVTQDLQDRRRSNVQFRWEDLQRRSNHASFNAPIAALNSSNFGRILTAGRSAHHAVRAEG